MVFGRARKEALAKTKGNYPAPLTALKVLAKTYHRASLIEGRRIEVEAFADLACSPVSRNLVWLFQASQRMRKRDRAVGGATAPKLSSAGVVGAGIMGSGIAWAISNAGVPVRLKDIDWDAVARGMSGAARTYRQRVKRRRMSEGQMNLAMHRITPTVDYRGFEGLDVVVEAVLEDLRLKKKVLREIESHVRPDAIICTNTSSLPLSELASALDDPKRFVGLHFFNPVDRMPLVEVVPGRKTDRHALLAAAEFVRGMDKTPIVVGDCPGFLVNRILLPYLVESAWMFDEGVPTERIDELLERFGMPMGPLALVDEVGLDVGYKVAKVLESAYGSRMHVPPALDAVAGAGDLLGKKNGQGFYVYRNHHKKPNPRAAALGQAGTHAHLSDDEIVDRAVLIMVNEAARCLEERVVDGPEALDMAMIMGTGFAPFRGGLLRYADERGVPAIKARLEELADRFGERFRPAPLIEQIASNGGHFYTGDAA